MTQTVPVNLENRIIAALTNPESELWYPHLTYDLMRIGLQKLYEDIEVTEAYYGTTRVILKDIDAERIVEGAIFNRNEIGEIRNETFIEILPTNIAKKYKGSGIDFYTREELRLNTNITDCLRDAFEIIRYVPSLFASVHYLVKSVHLIKPEDDDYDVSFSEPHIPFSIFVSVPQNNSEIYALRVAEAIVHEAMHLQLTLIEYIVQLVVPNGKFYYSPWKEEYRTPQGVMHALYVFRVVDKFLHNISNNQQINSCLLNHIQTRLKEVEKQIRVVYTFASCSTLTKIGSNFVKRLVNNSITN